MKPRSRYRGLTLFATVGSTRFDKLIESIISDDSAEQLNTLGFAKVILQVGKSEYDIKQVEILRNDYKIDIEIYDYKSSIQEDIEKADVVIGHAGAGTCLEVLRANKRLLVVINESLMDNHQLELADQLEKENFVVKTTVDELSKNLDLICDTKFEKFPSKNSFIFEEIFEEALKKVNSRL